MAKVPETVTVGADGFGLPVEEILTGRGFITGKSGAGKSNTASVVAEELLAAGISLFIIDTDGEYYGLKEQFDVLHAGADSDCDIQVGIEDATMLAETALEEDVPVILDVSGFLDGEQVDDLIEKVVTALFALEKQVRKPFPLFVEEVHEFIPEAGGLGDLGEMLIRVAKRGRKRGLGLIGMSQRPAAVSKDFITQCDWIVWHRLTWDNDTRVVSQILGSDAGSAVQDLATGEALVMTDWDESVTRVQFRRKRTLDAGATPGLAALEEGADVEVVPGDDGPADPGPDVTPEDAVAAAATTPSVETDDVDETEEADDAAEPPPDDDGDADEAPVLVEPSSGTVPERQGSADRSEVVERLAANRNSQEVTIPADRKRAPAEAHPNDATPVRVLWEFGHMMIHLFLTAAQSVVDGVRSIAGSVASAGRDAASRVAVAGQRASGDGGEAAEGRTDRTEPGGASDEQEMSRSEAAAARFEGSDRGADGGEDSARTGGSDDLLRPDGSHAGGVHHGESHARGRTDAPDPGLTRTEALFVKAGLVAVVVLLVVLVALVFG